MNRLFKNENSLLKQNISTLIILTVSGAFIYALPYFRNYYYDTFVQSFGINNTQMAALGSVYGGVSIISFSFGGFFADRWPTKHLLPISLVSTGILGFVLLTYPPYPVVFAIHALWGVTCILTFWNALIIALRGIASSDEQGKVFGFFEGGRGIVNMVQSAFVLGIFGYLSKVSTEQRALSAVILTYSIICVLLGVLVYISLGKEDKKVRERNIKTDSLIKKDVLKKILKMPTTWLSAIIIFTSYAVIISYFYITPYTTAVFGVSPVIAAALGYLSQYCRPFGSFFSGIAADKIGSSKMMSIAFIVLITGWLGVVIIPGKQSMIWLLIVFIAAIYTSMYGIQSLHYAILEEGDYPIETMGTATAIIMPIGYSSEFFVPIIAGLCLDKWSGVLGYKIFFSILIFICSIGFLSSLIWMKLTKEKRNEILENRLENNEI